MGFGGMSGMPRNGLKGDGAGRVGRPRKSPDERRSARVPFARITDAELAHIEAQAAAAGIDPAEYVRRRVLGQRIAPARTVSDDRLIVEINRVGVNLNQIAARFNATGEQPEGLADALAEVTAALRKVADGS